MPGIVLVEARSITEKQEALDHKNPQMTSVYLRRISV